MNKKEVQKMINEAILESEKKRFVKDKFNDEEKKELFEIYQLVSDNINLKDLFKYRDIINRLNDNNVDYKLLMKLFKYKLELNEMIKYM